MSDIIERLRNCFEYHESALIGVTNEAADEIEALRQQVSRLENALEQTHDTWVKENQRVQELEAWQQEALNREPVPLSEWQKMEAKLAGYIKEGEIKANVNKMLVEELAASQQRVKELEEDANDGIKEYTQLVSKHVSCVKELAALKQQGEPVANIKRNQAGQIFMVGSDGEHFDMSKYIGASLFTSAPTIPEGWQVVPIEPNDDMCRKGVRDTGQRVGMDQVYSLYKSMLAAAPKPEDVK